MTDITNRPIPETDAIEDTRIALKQERCPAYGDALAKARRLEQQRDALREAAEKCLEALAVFKITDKLKPYENVCDEWRQQMLSAHDFALQILNQAKPQ